MAGFPRERELSDVVPGSPQGQQQTRALGGKSQPTLLGDLSCDPGDQCAHPHRGFGLGSAPLQG